MTKEIDNIGFASKRDATVVNVLFSSHLSRWKDLELKGIMHATLKILVVGRKINVTY